MCQMVPTTLSDYVCFYFVPSTNKSTYSALGIRIKTYKIVDTFLAAARVRMKPSNSVSDRYLTQNDFEVRTPFQRMPFRSCFAELSRITQCASSGGSSSSCMGGSGSYVVLVCVDKCVLLCSALLTYEHKSATESKQSQLCHFIVCSFVQQLFRHEKLHARRKLFSYRAIGSESVFYYL